VKDVFVSLCCSFDASDFCKYNLQKEPEAACSGERRTLQYGNGFKKFFEIYKNYSDLYDNIYIIDNTLQNKSSLDQRVINEIPESANFIFTQQNNYGKLNKGAGIVENWEFLKEKIFEYEFMFHFEPRLLLNSSEIFDRFVKERKTTFLTHYIEQFKTGAMILKISDLKRYLNHRKALDLCYPYISLEDDIYHFFKKNKKDFTLIENSGMLWHDAAIDTWVEY